MPKGIEHHRTHRLPDELDRLLRAYFHAEMPDPWPRAPGAAPPRRVQPVPPWQRLRGRLALAAAVSFFLVGSFLLTQSFPQVTEGIKHNTSNSGGPEIGRLKRPVTLDRKQTLDELPDSEGPKLKLQEIIPPQESKSGVSFGGKTRDGELILINIGKKKK